ncbi:outer membrane protein assembly factor BamA [Erythrobacter sp. A6_0]|uniref:outer membrane protein assembly factor BamA n=1 Tax=Erythrobacter sp. A6_0 TaxID=2821089 RepID=UPI001ADB3F0E|nr:outer membrane protein assembly factor BamA [Erythrobacter sp. A6_0]MBO9510964.1 outer membrane protein assembly factor BamA [Erythrobacter sp. A6_0]
MAAEGSKLTGRMPALLLAGSMLAGVPGIAAAQEAAAEPVAQPATQQAQQIVRTISVSGAQRLEPQTILSYIQLRPGQEWNQVVGDQVLKELYATELFANASVSYDNGTVLIEIVENPVVNRIILEGNERIKDDKIVPEIRLAPRQIFTRSKVRADVARIIELYKRQGRFAATVEPNMVQLAQNRVDVVFEINEGPKSKVRQINIIGNEVFSDGDLKGEMVTKEARLLSILSSNTSYDPDRLAFDQAKLREFYLTEGYADFRVVSAVAELTPDRRDFIITYVVEEGERYKFGDVAVDSQLRDFDSDAMSRNLPMKTGEFYNAKLIEDTVEQLTELAGSFGYAFADVSPRISRNPETRTMDVNFIIQEAPRVYVERVDVNGNTLTQDKVVRREFRLVEGDAFSTLQVARSAARINSLGFFQEGLEINQVEGSAPDRIVLEANVEEQATGELQLSAGFSSIENFILAGSIRQRNFRGRGQTVGLSVNYSRYARSAEASFSEPYLFDRNISAGVDVYRRDYSSFNFNRSDRNTTYKQATTGFSLRAGVPLTEYSSLIGSYTLNYDDVTLDENQFFSDLDGDGVRECDPFRAGRYLCEAIGQRTSSILGLSFNLDATDSRLRPTRGRNLSLTAQYAGLGGSVEYLSIRGRAGQYWPLGGGFVFSLTAEGGAIRGFRDEDGDGTNDVRLTDRFFLGSPQIRGFDIRGVGPRVLRRPIMAGEDGNPVVITERDRIQDDAIGGTAYYLGRAEIDIPLGSGARSLGLRPSVFVDIGAVFNVEDPVLIQNPFGAERFFPERNAGGVPLYFNNQGTPENREDDVTLAIPDGQAIPDGFVALGQGTNAFEEVFLGDTPSPRISVGVGVNWNSPFGPFRIDLAYALKKVEGDDTKLFSFNVGTQF